VVLACPSCALRYPLEERFCRSCGMPLVYAGAEQPLAAESEAHERARKINPEYSSGDIVRVAFASNQAEAELVQNLLIEEGIPSMLRRSGGFDVPDFLAAGPRDVLVPSSGAAAARDVLLAADLEGLAVAAAAERASALRHLTLAVAVLTGGFVTAVVTWLLLDVWG
jgi:hypothetical protein